MDENEYKSVTDSLIPVSCVFEKSILVLKTQCIKSTRINIAERELVVCASLQYAERCKSWLKILRKKSQFSLRLPEQLSVLPHAKEIKVQVGGMLALDKMYGHLANAEGRPDIYKTLECCLKQTTDFEGVPFDVVVREVMLFRLR